MPADHPPEEILFIYAEEPDSLTGREGVDSHLASCDDCQSRVEDFRLVASEMRNPEAWATAANLRGEGGSYAALVRFERRIEREDREATRLLGTLVSDPYRFHVPRLVRRPRLHTGGIVRLLARRANEECDNRPLFALSLAEAATVFAERLADDYYPAAGVFELRGTAWKVAATACRFLGRYQDALEALGRAERAYRRLLSPVVSMAAIQLARAIVFWKMERYDDALIRVRSAADAFARAGDMPRYVDARQVEAVIHHRRHDYHAAGIAYQSLYEAGTAACDPDMIARAAHNLGVVHVEQGDVGTACKYFLEALQIVEGLGLRARAVNCKWGVAWVAFAAGNFEEADRRYRSVTAEMHALGMTDTATMQVQHAEVLFMLGRFDEVVELAQKLVATFRAAERITGALTAAVFLREAAASRTLNRKQVRFVCDYFVRLQDKADLIFVPPTD
ncbi:MAG: hypothetical protein JWO56_1262, partial [Acidobacteria bacterium]|nr:hypothetical protein [Acidobacteriota bacterium]